MVQKQTHCFFQAKVHFLEAHSDACGNSGTKATDVVMRKVKVGAFLGSSEEMFRIV